MFITCLLPLQLTSSNFYHSIYYNIIHSFIAYRAGTAKSWHNRDVEDIWNEHPTGIFSSPDDDMHRQQLTLEELKELQMQNEDEREVPIYTHQGFQIQRRLGRFTRNSQPLGILINLGTIHQLFGNNNYHHNTVYQHGLPGSQKSSITVYPQAGLRSAGHFQASSLMANFYPHIESLNHVLRDDDNNNGQARFPIFGVACQGYNSVMHSTRGYGAQHHEAQQGIVTVALGGRFTCEGHGQEKWKKFTQNCY